MLMIRIYAIAAVIISIFFLIIGIRAWIKVFFSAEEVLQFPFLQKEASFTIKKAGYYTIAIHGKLLKAVPQNWLPVITSSLNQDQIQVKDVLMKIQKTNFGEGSIELYLFNIISPGEYTIQLKEGSLPGFNLGRVIAQKLNLDRNVTLADLSNFSISVSSGKSVGQKLILFPQMMLAFAGLFGFVFGLIAAISPKEWNNFNNPAPVNNERQK